MFTPRIKLSMPVASLLIAAAAVCAPVASACEDVTRHPGSEAYVALRQSLIDQPRGPVQMMYKLGQSRFAGWPVPVKLHFWPIDDYDDARLVVTPSAGLELVGLEGSPDVPYKGALDFVVRPKADGFHYLKVEVIAQTTEGERRHTSAIPVSAGGHGEAPPQMSPNKPSSFAGPRLREALEKPR